MFDQIGAETTTRVTLFTDSHVVRGDLRTRQRRMTDVLNAPDASFLVLDDVVFEDFGARAIIERAAYAQINLGTILFAVADTAVEPTPELRMSKQPEKALVSVPPFKVIGRIHLLPERDLHEALSELMGRFLPVTEGIYWSDSLGDARTPAPFLAFNHARAQILAPYQEQDVWAGMPASTSAAGEPSGAGDTGETSQPVGSDQPVG
jgi:hypothetical protein